MLAEPESMFKLSEEPGSLGLSCSKEGVVLAGVPLLSRAEPGFEPRPEAEIRRLLGEAYGDSFPVESVISGLGVAAKALNAGDLPRAMIAAVQLKLPSLDWHRAVRMAQADDALNKYNPNQPRDWHGRWTTGDGESGTTPAPPLLFISDTSAPSTHPAAARTPNPTSAPSADQSSDAAPVSSPPSADAPAARSLELPKDWVHLPPGERNDELGDLLEWIANAKPEDQKAIRAEIKRQFYDKGDFVYGDIFNGALSAVLKNGPLDRETREQFLAAYEHYTKRDPAAAGLFATIMGIVTPGPSGPARVARELPAATEAISVAEAAAASEVWKLGWAERGRRISEALGQNLIPNFPTIDRFAAGIVTSIKSIDLNAVTYQDPARLLSRLNRYIDQMAGFTGAKLGDDNVPIEKIVGRALNVAIPKGSMTATQRAAFEAAKRRAQDLGVDFITTPF